MFTFTRCTFHARKPLSSSRNYIQVHKSSIKGHIGIKNDVTGSGVHYKCMQYEREGLASGCHEQSHGAGMCRFPSTVSQVFTAFCCYEPHYLHGRIRHSKREAKHASRCSGGVQYASSFNPLRSGYAQTKLLLHSIYTSRFDIGLTCK